MNVHYTKEEVVKNDFLFVSYKHDDSVLVNEVISFLIEKGVRLWYDADLVIGDKWPEIAERLIKNEHCRGVIFFNSEASFISEPIYQERAFTLERAEVCKRKGLPFFVFPVNIGKASTMLLLKSVFASLPEEDKEIERIFPLKFIKGISTIFSSDTIYCFADPDNDEYKTKLFEHIKKVLPSVIDNDALSAREIAQSLGSVNTSVSFGLCKGKAVDSIPEYFLVKDQCVEYKGKKYIIEGGIAYEAQRIKWSPVYCDDNVFVLLSQNIVGIRNGGEPLNKWLTEEFLRLAFSEEEKAEILEIRLLSERDISKSQDPDFLVFNDSESHWWLDSRSGGALQKVVKKDGTVYNSGYNFRTKKSGVRPVVCVKKEFVVSLKQK